MTANEYQREALKYEGIYQNTNRMTKQFPNNQVGVIFRLSQGLMGLCGESGESIDILKKHLYQGHELNREHLVNELGDVAWYLALSADALGYSLEEILKKNLEKLARRYPDGQFDAEKSINRPREDV